MSVIKMGIRFAQYKSGPEFRANDKVRINTGNADGSIPSLPDYRGTILYIVDKRRAYVIAEDGDEFEVHVGRLIKL